MNDTLSDELLDARLHAFLVLRAEEIAPTAPPADLVAMRLGERLTTTPRWWSWWASVPVVVRLGISLTLLLLAFAAALMFAGRPSPRALANGPITFLNGPAIEVMEADGTGQRTLATVQTPDPGATCCWLAYSPDGSRLLAGSSSSLDVMGADGTGRGELVRGIGLGYPSVSPDGSRVALAMAVGGSTQMFIVDVASGSKQLVSGGLAFAAGPTWSHDGRRLAFAGAQRLDGPQAVFVVAADGSDLHRVGGDFANGLVIADPGVTWSPDDLALLVATSSVADSVSEIDVLSTDGTELRSLLPSNLQGQAPIWSPDGKLIAFGGRQAGGAATDLYVIQPDGTGARRLAMNVSAYNAFDYAWSADSAAIAFADESAAAQTGRADVRTVRRDGSDPRLLAAAQVNGSIAWPAAWP